MYEGPEGRVLGPFTASVTMVQRSVKETSRGAAMWRRSAGILSDL